MAQFFITEFVFFLVGEETTPETHNCETNSVRSRLIERCNHVSEEVRLYIFCKLVQLISNLLFKQDFEWCVIGYIISYRKNLNVDYSNGIFIS